MTPQELKNSILQLAIQGKLVEQRPEEGTAAELVKISRGAAEDAEKTRPPRSPRLRVRKYPTTKNPSTSPKVGSG